MTAPRRFSLSEDSGAEAEILADSSEHSLTHLVVGYCILKAQRARKVWRTSLHTTQASHPKYTHMVGGKLNTPKGPFVLLLLYVGSPGAVTAYDSELPCGAWELNPGPLEELPVLLATKSSL